MTTSYVVGVGDEVLIGACIILILVYFLYQVLVQFIPSNENNNSDNASEDLSSGRVRANSYDCSICLGEAQLAVETNCGHVYCGQCIISYYDTAVRAPFDTPSCPYCRQRITMILLYFSETERNSAELDIIDRRSQIINSVRSYNRRFSGDPRSIWEHLRDLPVLLRHLWSFVWSADGLSWLFRLRIFTLGGVAALYLLSPFDIVPEAAFGIFGLLDDLVIVALFLIYSSILYRNFVVQDDT